MDEKVEYTGYEKILRDLLDPVKRKENTSAKAVRTSFCVNLSKVVDTIAKLRELSGDRFDEPPVDSLSIACSQAADKIIDSLIDSVVNDILLHGMADQDNYPF